MAYYIGSQELGTGICSGTGQGKKGRERGRVGGTTHKFWWLIKKKEDEDVWLGTESALD